MRVAVLAGGRSSEHDVSLDGAESVRSGLAQAGHEPLDVRLGSDGAWSFDGEPFALEPGGGLLGADVVFPVLHGPFGEDGTVQGLLELLDVAYVGAGVAASAVCMDKVLFKELMAAADLPQVTYAAVRDGDPLPPIALPVFVKPARLGSSVGISKATGSEELAEALRAAFEHDSLVIVEAMAEGMEVECSVIGNERPEVSQPGEIVVNADWYDYEAKYTPGGMELVVPPRLPDQVREQVRSLAAEVFTRSRCEGLARVDFFVEDPSGEARVLVNELNTIPGFTATSVFPKLWSETGLAYPDLLNRLLELAVERFERDRRYRH
jgi:D-alanine-D-alanine ligase